MMRKKKTKTDEQKFREFLRDTFPSKGGIIIADGFQNAFVGVLPLDEDTYAAVYSIEGIIEILITRDSMTEEQANEFFEYNILSFKTDKGYTPVFIHTVCRANWI